MSTAKDLLNAKRNRELRNWWVAIVRNDKFDEIKLIARSEFLDTGPSADKLLGAMEYERIIENLPLAEEATEDVLSQVSPGLNHDLDISREPDKKKK